MGVKTTFRGGGGMEQYPQQAAKQMQDIRPSSDQLRLFETDHPDTSMHRYMWNRDAAQPSGAAWNKPVQS
jgi:hypothetical protein